MAMNLFYADPLFREVLGDPFNILTQPGVSSSRRSGVLGQGNMPHMHCDVLENDKTYCIAAELAGVPKDKVCVEINGDELTISCDKCDPCCHGATTTPAAVGDKSEWGYIMKERSFGKIRRQFRLPSYVNKDSCISFYQDGTLRLHFDKLAEGSGGKIVLKIA